MLNKNQFKHLIWLFIALVLRFFIFSKYFHIFWDRVEIATPLNSFKRIQEGAYLLNKGINPYNGDMVHESPHTLFVLKWFLDNYPYLYPSIYFGIDIISGYLLFKAAKEFLKNKVVEERQNRDNYAKDADNLLVKENDVLKMSEYVMLAYLFNPFSILNCISLTSTVISNFILSLYFYFLVRKNLFLCLVCLALESIRTFYPFVLLAPIILTFNNKSIKNSAIIIGLFSCICAVLFYSCFLLVGNWNFIEKTIGFIFFCDDLQPNIGLFWYFFTEMFDHFRTMFLITFQMNATVLYLLPLSIKLRNEPIMLATILTALIAIFRSYPSIGDIALYLSLLPIWKKCWTYMAHNFVVFCFFLITILAMPTLWHLWIYAGSANANFYFGITLAFSTGQIFLVTDLLFAYIKREFCLYNGQKFIVDGQEAKITLE